MCAGYYIERRRVNFVCPVIMYRKFFLSGGITLAEVLVAIFILTLLIFSIVGAVSVTLKSSRIDRDITDAISFSQQAIEGVRVQVKNSSDFVSLSDVPYTFVGEHINKRLIYDIDVTELETGQLKKVSVKVYYHDETSGTPLPEGG